MELPQVKIAVAEVVEEREIHQMGRALLIRRVEAVEALGEEMEVMAP